MSPTTWVADWVDPKVLVDDPYPAYERLRRETPVAWVPALDRFLVTTFRECFDIEMDQELFSSREHSENSTMVRSMGRTMLRKDDPEHKADRSAMGPALRPRTIKVAWRNAFVANAARYIERVREVGPGVDLLHEFAIPFIADNLSAIVGFRGVPAATIMDWSHTLVGGVANVGGDEAVWRETDRVRAEMDAAIDAAIARVSSEPDDSIISSILRAPHPISDDDLRANVRLTIAGGMNEPSHAIAVAVWALSTYPAQLDLVRAGTRNWGDVFEETARLVSPVGMYPRTVTRDTVIRGVPIPAGSTLGLVIGSANRDESQFEHPEDFDLMRENVTHLAFGNGTHVCAGNWAARDMVGEVALPMLYDAFPELRVATPDSINFRGWVFRGPEALPVVW